MRAGNQSYRELIIMVVVLVLTLAAYVGSLRNGFTNWDDTEHIYHNPIVTTFDAQQFKALWSSKVNNIYIPLTTLSFALEHKFFGWNAFNFHLNNLLLHLLVTGLIFCLGRQLGLNEYAAGWAALLFGLHPIHVESVAWLTERKDVLYAAFYMLALITYGRYVQTGQRVRFWQTVILGMLSLLAKPMALSLPLILLLLDVAYRRPLRRPVWSEKGLVAAVFAPIVWVTLSANLRSADIGLLEGGLVWVWSLTFYLKAFLWPVALSPIYPVPEPIALTTPDYLIGMGILAVTITILWRWHRQRWVWFGFAYFFASIFFLLKTDPYLDAHAVADRFMYLPSLGFCLLFGWMADHVTQKLLVHRREAALAFNLMLVILMGGLTIKTYQQTQIWRDSITIWEYVLSQVPGSSKAYHNRGSGYADRGEWERALQDYQRALAINPELPLTYYNRALALYQLGQVEAAREQYQLYEYYQEHGTPQRSWTH